MAEHESFILLNSQPVTESGCWIWLGAWSAKGYGSVSRGGQNYAHRLSYQTFIGPIPDGLLVCHKCDTRACCNPAHLFAGTHAHNSADAKSKGRMHPGEKNYNSKLTPELVQAIRGSIGEVSAREWARRLGMSHATIAMARRGETWRAAA